MKSMENFTVLNAWALIVDFLNEQCFIVTATSTEIFIRAFMVSWRFCDMDNESAGYKESSYIHVCRFFGNNSVHPHVLLAKQPLSTLSHRQCFNRSLALTDKSVQLASQCRKPLSKLNVFIG